jgi:hypothetical protein
MKFQRAAEFICVFHLTWLLLLYTNTWFSVYCFHCIHGIVTLKPKVRSGIGGKRLFEGNSRDTRWFVSDFVRAMNEANRVNWPELDTELPAKTYWHDHSLIGISWGALSDGTISLSVQPFFAQAEWVCQIVIQWHPSVGLCVCPSVC